MKTEGLRWEIADSEVARMDMRSHDAWIHLSAACLIPHGPDAQKDARRGFGHGLRCRIGNADVMLSPGASSVVHAPVGRISHGEVWLEGRRHTSLPVPGDWPGPVVLRLTVGHHDSLEVRGQGLRVDFGEAPANFTESLAC